MNKVPYSQDYENVISSYFKKKKLKKKSIFIINQ